MNARSGVTLTLGALLMGLLWVSWSCDAPVMEGPPLEPEAPATPGAARPGHASPVAARSVEACGNLRHSAEERGGVRLRILDATTGTPLPDARVHWRADGKDWREARLGLDATAHLPCEIGETITLHAESDGYCTLRGTLELSALSADVLLERGGSVSVIAKDADGNPAAGVEVALLPPLVSGRWESDWHAIRKETAPVVPEDLSIRLRIVDGLVVLSDHEVPCGSRLLEPRHVPVAPVSRTTGADGVARWHGVAAGDSYRCGLLGQRPATIDPPHEDRRLRATPDGVVVGRPPPPNLSGAFVVVPTEETTVRAVLMEAASVHGSLRCPAGVPVQVKLCRIRQAGGRGVSPVTTVDAENLQEVDRGGGFRFENVRPGIFAIRSCWLENGYDVYLVSTTFRLIPGMDLDLGELAPMAGADIGIRAELREKGRRMTPAQVFADPRSAAASLVFSFLPDSRTVADGVTEGIILPFDREYVLHGVPAGRLQLQASPLSGQATTPHTERLEPSEVLELSTAALRDTVPVAVQVHSGVSVRITVVGEDGRPVPVDIVQAIDRSSGHAQSLQLRSESAGLLGSLVRMEKGDYLLTSSLSLGDRWIAGVAGCEVRGDGDSIRLEMLPAATIRGRCVPLAGAVESGEPLRWSPAAFAERGVWLFSAIPDEQGDFVLHGIPPGVELVGDSGLPTLQPTAKGQDLTIGTVTWN